MFILNRKKRKIGMNIFIKYFFHIKDKPEIEIFKKEKFTKKSKQSRLNAGKNIFKKGWEKEALEVVISSRASEETINLATEIYLQLFPGETPRTIRFVRPEFMFGKQIVEKLFDGFEIIPQYIVGDFVIDWYIPELKLAIEFDENHHKRRTKIDTLRQTKIEKKLHCKFLRYKE
mgnify:CR=1 FL=1